MAVTPVDVVIPTKSNLSGVQSLLAVLKPEATVRSIFIVSDGPKMFSALSGTAGILLSAVEEGAGIHVMWNIALNNTTSDAHMLFLNDDVSIEGFSIYEMSRTLDNHPELGLVCPTYAPETFTEPYRPVTDICGGRYDGSGGLAGFAMMLRNTLAQEWRFDESMKWWFGDNDILNWVTRTKQMTAAICKTAFCSDNESWTINNDPPKTFLEDVRNDQRIFAEKWG